MIVLADRTAHSTMVLTGSLLFAPDVAAVVLFYLAVFICFIQFLYVLVYYILHQLKALDLLQAAVSSDYGFICSVMDYLCGFVRLAVA